MTEITPAYLGEALLLRWGESHKGRTVTFQLEPESKEHPFKPYKCGDAHGQRVKLVAVLIDENEEAVSAATTQVGTSGEAKAQSSKSKSHTWDTMSRSQRAAVKCGDLSFVNWIRSEHFKKHECVINNPDREAEATAHLKLLLDITSRRELDTDPAKADEFDKLMASYDHRDMVR